MATPKNKRPDPLTSSVDAPESRVRIKSRDPDLLALEAALAEFRAGAIDEEEYIERAIALMRRDFDAHLSAEQREDITCVLRYTCWASPKMRVRLGLDPFGDND
jgi:hypothetical protein